MVRWCRPWALFATSHPSHDACVPPITKVWRFMFVSDSFYSSFFIIFISFSAQSLKKQKKQTKLLFCALFPSTTIPSTNFCCWLINIDNFIGHAGPASSVCFVLFFFLFSSSFSPSVKGVPLPMGKSQKKKRCCEDWTRLFNEKNEKDKQQQPKELMRNPVAITMKITELWQTIPFLSRKEKKKRRIYFKLE